MKSIATSILMVLYLVCYGQNIEFYSVVSKDTVSLDEGISVKFVIKNGNGDFQAPDFEHFELISGPNVSSSFSFINGESSQEMSYEYILRPVSLGVYVIAPAYLVSKEVQLETQAIEITVVDPSSGIIDTAPSDKEPSPFLQDSPQPQMSKDEMSKKKRKFRKI